MNKQYLQPDRTRGAALLLFVVLFMFASLAISFAVSRGVLSAVSEYALLERSKQSYFAAEAVVEDMTQRTMGSFLVDATETLILGDATATATSTFDSINGWLVITGAGEIDTVVRSAQLFLFQGIGASFNFGVQTGNGGFEMANGSAVVGNVFSNGSIVKVLGGTATIFGDVISAGSSGLIEDIYATGTARARVVRDSDIDGDVYAYTLDGGIVDGDAYIFERVGGAVVGGSEFPHEPEEATTSLPIPDSVVDEIKQDIIDNGTVIASTEPECDPGGTDEYEINTDTTLGFVKIECDLRVKKQGSATVLTLTGSVWVEGDIILEGGPDIVIDSAVGNRTVPFVADDPADRALSSTITIENGTTFTGSGDPKSYILLLSMNEDAENGFPNNVDAIFTGQSSAGDMLLYAGHGRVTLANSITLKEVTAYQVSLGNSAIIEYESGLVNTLFTSGPGGGFEFAGWGEI